MTTPRLDELACVLAAADERQEPASAFARELGVDAMIVLIHDPETGALVSAPGFRPTLPGGKGWNDVLAACTEKGRHRGEVLYPDVAHRAGVEAQVLEDGSVFVFIGGALQTDALNLALLCVLSKLFRAEALGAAAASRSAVAMDIARQAKSLMTAVDLSRSEAVAARKEAEIAARAKDEFLAVLGHELRNPLAPITSALHLMKLKDPATFRTEREIIDRQMTHMSRLVDDLLDVSRIASGNIELRREYVDLAEIVKSAVETVRPLLAQKDQVLTLHTNHVPVHGDPVRLGQVFNNLLTNASRYTPEYGHVGLRVERGAGTVTVSVCDSGIGIDPELLPHVFDLFFQGRQSLDRSRGGLGLGLAIVKNLVRLHGGSVEAVSEGDGKGSEFRVHLPVMARRCEQPGVPPQADLPAGAGERVLIVDDNTDFATTLAQGLREIGYDTATAPDGPSALALAGAKSPAIVLLDIGLPGMDGYQLAAAMRDIAVLRDVPIIALTGYGQDRDREESRKAGINLHLTKPIDPSALADAIRSFVGAEPPAPEGEGGISAQYPAACPSLRDSDAPA